VTILFTGYPGFLGQRLLPRLLGADDEGRAVCLVQEKFAGVARAARARLEEADPTLRGRIDFVAGDITQPGLGLASGDAQRVRDEVESCFHLAAVYDLAVGRELALRVNVEGTRHLLAVLAGAPRFRRLDYVSTAYVSGTTSGVFRETDLDVGQGFKNQYEETKFQAEVAVVLSRLPATIYRPSIVVGDSRTGETGKFDGPYFVLRAMQRLPSPGLFLQLGRGDAWANLVPVDFVIEAMTRLASDPDALGRTYHLTDPAPLTVSEVARRFAALLGKRFAFVPMPVGLARALLTPKPVQRFLGLPVESIDYFDDPTRHDATQATHDLGELGLTCPRFADYVPKLVEFYLGNQTRIGTGAMT
jgi:thioester reductase-like protein